MGNMLNMKRKLKSRTGSATVMALIFMLFLSIAGGAWVMMLASESGTASSDNAEQMAWYAAEAGIKRAEAQLYGKAATGVKNAVISDWDWTADNRKMENAEDFCYVDNGEKLASGSELKSQRSKYGVFLRNKAENDNGNIVRITDDTSAGEVRYIITSVGVYGDMRKVIEVDSDAVKLNPPRNQSTDIDTLLSSAGGMSSDGTTMINGTGIRDYQNSFAATHPASAGNYWDALKDSVTDGMVHQLTNYECTILFNSDDENKRQYWNLDDPKGSWADKDLKSGAVDNKPETLTNLYLRPAMAYFPDGTMADIQYVSNQPAIANTGSSSQNTTYTSCAVIVNGIVYARINVDFYISSAGKVTKNTDMSTLFMTYIVGSGTDCGANGASLHQIIAQLREPVGKRLGMRIINGAYESDTVWFIRQLMNNSVMATGYSYHPDVKHTAKPVKDYPANADCPDIPDGEYPYGDGKVFERNGYRRFQQVNYPEGDL